jgi:hypothetical protein
MSNEMHDYLYDKICEVVLEYGTMDTIEEVCSTSYSARNYVYGWKNGQRVVLMVWFDDELGEWRIEHRESN